MTVSDQAWAAAITAKSRWPTLTVRADWDHDGSYDHPLSDLSALVEEVTVERNLTGELPPAVGIVEGYAAAALTMRLSGRWPGSVDARSAAADTLLNACPNPKLSPAAAGWRSLVSGPDITTIGEPGPVEVSGMSSPRAWRHTSSGPGSIAIYSARTANIVIPGRPWSGCLEFRCSADVTSVVARANFYTAAGGAVSSTAAWTTAALPAGEVKLARVAGVAPPGAACVDVFVYLTHSSAGQVDTDATCARLAPVADPALAYGDGDTAEWSWDGHPGYSTSRRAPLALLSDQDAAAVFAAHRGDSPLYRQPLLTTDLTFDTGFDTSEGVRESRRFTGSINRVDTSSADRTVRIDALDPANRLRAAVTMAPVAMDELLLRKHGPEVYRTRFNSQYVIDRVLRANGIYSSPPPRPNAILSVTCHGACVPEVGSGGMPEDVYSSYRGAMWSSFQHPFGMLYPVVPGQQGHWSAQTPVTAAPGTGVGVSLWVKFDGDRPETENFLTMPLTPSGSSGLVRLVFGFSPTGRPNVTLRVDSTSAGAAMSAFTAPTGQVWQFVGMHVAFGASSMMITFRCAGITWSTTVAIPNRPYDWASEQLLDFAVGRAFTNLQVWQSVTPPPSGPWQGEVWTSQADLDPGANELTAIPELLEENSWEVIKEVVAAELGQCGFDENGRFYFRSRAATRSRGAVETLTADKELDDLTTIIDRASVRNEVTVSTAPSYLTDWQRIVEAEQLEEFDSAPGLNVFEMTMPSGTYQLPTSGLRAYETVEGWRDLSDSPKAASVIHGMLVRRDQHSIVVTSGVYVACLRVSPWKFFLLVANYNSFWVRFATPTTFNQDNNTTVLGDPALKIPARLIEQRSETLSTVVDQGSVAAYGRLSLRLGLTRWRQWAPALAGVCEGVVAQTAHPLPVVGELSVPHDPRRRIGRLVDLVDTNGAGRIRAVIAGLATQYARGEPARDRIVARPIAPPGLGLLNDPDLGLADDTLIAA